MDAKEAKTHAKILVSKYTGGIPTPVSRMKGELDRLLFPLEPTIFMTKRNSDRRAAPILKKSLFKKLFGFLGCEVLRTLGRKID